MNRNELKHHGVKGMKWGVRRIRQYFLDKEKKILEKNKEIEKTKIIKDAKAVEKYATKRAKQRNKRGIQPEEGGMSYIGGDKYRVRTRTIFGSVEHHPYHIVNKYGKVKLSYISGRYGDRYIAASKKYIEEHVDLNKHFKNTKNLNIEYGVYDDD